MGYKVYDWYCEDCANKWEQWMRNEEKPECPECKSSNATRLPPTTNVNFNYGPYKKYLRNT
jgi:putative FmdB family regulatory protein